MTLRDLPVVAMRPLDLIPRSQALSRNALAPATLSPRLPRKQKVALFESVILSLRRISSVPSGKRVAELIPRKLGMTKDAFS